MSRAPAFQFYAGDFLSDSRVARMTYEEVGVYVVLLCHAWNDGGLPADTKELARLLRLSHRKFLALWDRVGECWHEDGGRYVQKRMEEVRGALGEHRRQRSAAGRRSAEERRKRSGARAVKS